MDQCERAAGACKGSQSQTGAFNHGEDGVSWEMGDGIEAGSSVLAPDGNVHRNTAGALFRLEKRERERGREIKITVFAFHDTLKMSNTSHFLF